MVDGPFDVVASAMRAAITRARDWAQNIPSIAAQVEAAVWALEMT